MMRRTLLLMLLLCPASGFAHALSNAFLNLNADGNQLYGTLRVRLQDTALMADLDANRDRMLTWGELKQAREALDRYIVDRLQFSTAAGACSVRSSPHQIEDLHTGRFLVVPLQSTCPAAFGEVRIRYTLLTAVDASHRGILQLRSGALVHNAVFTPGQPEVRVALRAPPAWQNLLIFFGQGVWHILLGFDHLLFLLALLLPLFRTRDSGNPVAAERARRIWVNVVKTVTAFTLAHSLTLLLSSAFEVALASALVEMLIALTVVLSGVNLLLPIFGAAPAGIAFGFGLVHGLGFAGALRDLALPAEHFIGSLLSFNLGVEAGQLLLVLAVFPLLLFLRRREFYARTVVPAAAVAVIALGGLWLVERGLAVL
jgi:hypothetical protein